MALDAGLHSVDDAHNGAAFRMLQGVIPQPVIMDRHGITLRTTGDLASLPGNRWKADLHDPRLREEADFYLSVRSSLPAHQVLHQLPLVCKIGAPDDVTLLINVALNGVPLVPLTSVPAALPLRLENQYFALDMHSDAAKSMLESGCCMIYAPGTMGDLKPELFAVLRT